MANILPLVVGVIGVYTGLKELSEVCFELVIVRFSCSSSRVWKALCAAESVYMPYLSATSGVSSVIPDFARHFLMVLNHLWSLFGLKSSPSSENLGSSGSFGGGGLAGPGSAIVFSGTGVGGSGSSGADASFLGLLGLSGLSIKVPGIECSLE